MSDDQQDLKHFARLCPHCKSTAVFKTLKSDYVVSDEVGCAFIHFFAKCEECGDFALFVQEDDGYGGPASRGPLEQLYPPRQRKLNFSVPPLVYQSYTEACKCEEAKTWLACAVMVGRTLEAVAREFDPKSKTFHEALKSMLSNGTVSQDIFDWSNHLRVARNQAAHPTEVSIPAQDAVDGLDFAQAILEILYDLKPRFETLKSRRAASS